jgi:DNA-binding LacI/PurR family transcriptional regulator
MPGRITISDVARAAGVSKGAASNALNDQPGVSEATRQRVKEAAVRLGWSPNRVARALSGSRSDSIGWAIVRSAKTPAIDPYFTQLFSGIELELEETDLSLVAKLVSDREAEADLYRRWAAERRVGGVLVTDVDATETRFDELRALELPFAAFRSTVAGEDAMRAELRTATLPVGPPTASVWFRETETVSALLDHALEHGHRRIGWISGDPGKAAVVLRERAVESWARRNQAKVVTLYTDYGPGAGAEAALRTIEAASPPTFIVFDSDIMALAGLSALAGAGRRVPQDISIASFIDSELCEAALPAITALAHPVVEYGRALTRRLIEAVDSAGADVWLPVPTLVERASVGPAAA